MSTDTINKAMGDAVEQQGLDTIHYRVIANEELLLLKPWFDRLNWALPDPAMAKVIVAEAGEGSKAIICGFQVIQFICHAEPMWIHPAMRGTGVAEGLCDNTVEYIEHDSKIKQYVAVAKKGSFASRLAQERGMKLLENYEVLVKQVE